MPATLAELQAAAVRVFRDLNTNRVWGQGLVARAVFAMKGKAIKCLMAGGDVFERRTL